MSKDYRVSVTVRNNLLLDKMEAMGVSSLAKLAAQTGVCYTGLVRLAALKESSVRRNGEWSLVAAKVAEHLRCLPEDIFPEDSRTVAKATNTATFKVDADDVAGLIGSLRSADGEAVLLRDDAQRLLAGAIADLPERDRAVISHRFGLDDGHDVTLDETGKRIGGLSRNRVSQIETRALRSLRYALGNRRDDLVAVYEP